MKLQRRRWHIALTVLLVAGCRPGNPVSNQRISTRSDHQKHLQERLRPTYRVTRPSIDGRTPLILFVSGCSGFSPPNYADRAEGLVRNGYAIAYVDYLSAQDIEDACEGSGESISAQAIGEYVIAAAADLQNEPYVERDHVFAVGWSLGGGGVLSALSSIDPLSSPLAAVAALYPACRGVAPWEASVPTLLLLGEFDNIQPPELCRALVKRVSLATVRVHEYPRAHHAFDAIELPVITESAKQPTVGYNPEAAAAAWGTILEFFSEHVPNTACSRRRPDRS